MSKVAVTKGTYHYIEVGQGRPLVLLHGMAASAQTWEPLIPELVDHGFKVYALDLLGHGDSRKPEDPAEYSIDAYYRHFAEWLDQIGLIGDAFPIISHSMGSYLSLLLARRQPQRVQRLAMLDPFYDPRQMSSGLKMSARRPGFSAKVMAATPEWIVYPAVRLNPKVANKVPRAQAHQIAHDYKRAHPNIVYTAATTRNLEPELSKIKSETLVIWGEQDPTLDPESFPHLVERLPAAQGEPIPNAGHMPHLTRPQRVQRALLPFLNGA